MNWIIWGARGHAAVLADLITLTGGRPVACFDNDPAAPGSVLGIKNLGGFGQFQEWMRRDAPKHLSGAVGIGGSRGVERRRIMHDFLNLGISAPPLIHPSAQVASSASIGLGSQVLAMSHVGSRASIGSGCVINSAASIDHDVILEDGVHVAPGVTICGEVRLGRDVFVGAGATVLPRLLIGAEAGVGAGATVTRSVASATWVWGTPARAKMRREIKKS